ncbi:MAG: hypothetical protein R3D68_14790 [Hyphomicrobiaceae bacterium]
MSRSESSDSLLKSEAATVQPWEAPRFLKDAGGIVGGKADVTFDLRQRALQLLAALPDYRSRGVAVGFGVGCLVTLPLAIIASGRMTHPQGSSAMPRITVVATQPVSPIPGEPAATAKPVRPVKAVWRDGILPTLEITVGDASDPAASERIGRARTLMKGGKIGAARELLTETGLDATPEGAFALAETFDPNVLASFNLSHAPAEVERARRLYAQALIGGLEHARQRLESLR